MQISFPHKSTKSEAVARVKKILADSQDKIRENATDVKADWEGDVLNYAFTAQKQHISGTLTITDSDFVLYAKLPLALRLFEGTIERMIKSEMEKMGASK